MTLAPYLKQTLVSSFSREEVLAKIGSKTQLIKSDEVTSQPVFNGHMEGDAFRLSLAVPYSHNALPLAHGSVEDTSRGSIIFLHLKLFPAAILYLVFFTTMAVFIGLVFILLSGNLTGGIIALTLTLANYLILNINFHRKAEETIHSFKEILAPEN